MTSGVALTLDVSATQMHANTQARALTPPRRSHLSHSHHLIHRAEQTSIRNKEKINRKYWRNEKKDIMRRKRSSGGCLRKMRREIKGKDTEKQIMHAYETWA